MPLRKISQFESILLTKNGLYVNQDNFHKVTINGLGKILLVSLGGLCIWIVAISIKQLEFEQVIISTTHFLELILGHTDRIDCSSSAKRNQFKNHFGWLDWLQMHSVSNFWLQLETSRNQGYCSISSCMGKFIGCLLMQHCNFGKFSPSIF